MIFEKSFGHISGRSLLLQNPNSKNFTLKLLVHLAIGAWPQKVLPLTLKNVFFKNLKVLPETEFVPQFVLKLKNEENLNLFFLCPS